VAGLRCPKGMPILRKNEITPMFRHSLKNPARYAGEPGRNAAAPLQIFMTEFQQSIISLSISWQQHPL
jgi:hypothetical protein